MEMISVTASLVTVAAGVVATVALRSIVRELSRIANALERLAEEG